MPDILFKYYNFYYNSDCNNTITSTTTASSITATATDNNPDSMLIGRFTIRVKLLISGGITRLISHRFSMHLTIPSTIHAGTVDTTNDSNPCEYHPPSRHLSRFHSGNSDKLYKLIHLSPPMHANNSVNILSRSLIIKTFLIQTKNIQKTKCINFYRPSLSF